MSSMRSSIVALVLLLLPTLAQAQLTKPQIEKAKKHFKAGQAALDKSKWETAVLEFTSAYEITKDPVVFYHIAVAHEKAGHLEDAILHYQRYLKEAKVSPAKESEVESKMAELQKKLQPTPPPEEPAKPPTEPVEPLAEPTPPIETPPPTETPDEEPKGGGWYRTAAWVTVGLTAALLTTGGVLATSASSREEEVDRLTDYRNPGTGQPHVYGGTAMEQYNEAYDEGDKLDTYAIVAFAAAGICAGAAVTFFIMDGSRDKADEGEEPSALRLTPTVTPQGAGVSAVLRF